MNRRYIWLALAALAMLVLAVLATAAITASYLPDACLEGPAYPAVELNMGRSPIRNHTRPEKLKRRVVQGGK